MLGSAVSSEGNKNRLPLPILIIDQDSPILHHALENDFPNLTFDLCPSLAEAEQHLVTKRYRSLITNVRFAEMADFGLLKWNQDQQPATPFLITVEAHQQAVAYKALEQGALDCILKPVNRAQAVPTIHRALRLYQIGVTIGQRKQILDDFKARHAALSRSLALNRPHKAQQANLRDRINAYERTIAALEKSLQYLNRRTNDLEHEARQRALERLWWC